MERLLSVVPCIRFKLNPASWEDEYYLKEGLGGGGVSRPKMDQCFPGGSCGTCRSKCLEVAIQQVIPPIGRPFQDIMKAVIYWATDALLRCGSMPVGAKDCHGKDIQKLDFHQLFLVSSLNTCFR